MYSGRNPILKQSIYSGGGEGGGKGGEGKVVVMSWPEQYSLRDPFKANREVKIFEILSALFAHESCL